MSNSETPKMLNVLNWAYDKCLQGLPGSATPQQIAEEYRTKYGQIDTAVDRLIGWQVAKCATSGFLSGLGGALTLPVAVPADLAVSMYINIRMVAAIAHLYGHDLHDDHTRTAVFACMVGSGLEDVLSKSGVSIVNQFAAAQLKRKVSREVLKRINREVGFRLVTRAGKRGAIVLTKIVPLAGGLVGGAISGVGCHTIGRTAKRFLAA
ncbi:EcsC family protein [Oligoflexus tunisiensis]|uniref:EcsC family protein n=1 Tax=Oligoflexus tunisiensis TaxID=708132 RepID=UPI00114C89C7|nr:EcsC family protein [Oligoflexus tunisiensis]